MSFLTAFLTMKATHWKLSSIDGFGKPIFEAPVTLNCRWEERFEYISGPQGVTISSRARVFLEVDVTIGDMLCNGESSSATPIPTAFRVLQFMKLPSLDGTDFERKAYL